MGNDYEELTDNLTSWVNEYRILWVIQTMKLQKHL